MHKVKILLVPYYHTFCEGEERPYCLNYMSSHGELASTRFTYDRKGRNDRAFYQQITGGRSSRNVHEFDKEGRMTRKFREYNDGETSTELFRYDDSGRLVEESFESTNGTKGTARYEYDADGRAVRMLCSGYKGWLHGVIEFDFAPDGRRLRARITQKDAAHGAIEYQYDSKGNLVREQWELPGHWNQTLQYVHEPVPETET